MISRPMETFTTRRLTAEKLHVKIQFRREFLDHLSMKWPRDCGTVCQRKNPELWWSALKADAPVLPCATACKRL
jgi:hypothetical protein